MSRRNRRYTDRVAEAEMQTLAATNACCASIAAYWSELPHQSREILRNLLDLPIGMIEQRNDRFYLSRFIAPLAGDGFHTRLARGFMQWTNGLDIEFYAPRRAARYGVTDFEPTDVSKLLNSAAQGDVVIFRSRDRRALHAVEKFFRKSPLMKERSKGDS